jgi:outer membrane protein
MNLLAAAIAAGAPFLAHGEDLMQIYTEARQADPSLAISEANRGAVGENVPQARSVLLPQINASLAYNRDDFSNNNVGPQQLGNGSFVLLSTNGVTNNHDRPAQATLTQSIFSWTNWAHLATAREQAASASSDYDTASQDLFVRTATAYFAVLTTQDQLTFAQANEKALARQLDQAEQRFQVGLSAITDVHEARANHDTAVAQVIQAQNNVDNAREALSEITGKSFGELKKLREQLPLNRPEPSELNAWVDTALKQNPQLASAEHLLGAAEHNISAARGGHYPTLNASVVRTDTPAWGNTSQVFGGQSFGPFHSNSITGDTTIGVVLNVPIFTGGLVSSQVRQAAFQRDAAQDQVELQRRLIVANTRNAYRAVIAGISEVEATKQAVVSAQSSLDATQAGFEVGTRTIVDVLLSQQTLFQAQSAYSQARHQFVLSGLQLKQSAGTIAAPDLEAVNALLE